MTMSTWEEVAGKDCELCASYPPNPATHFYDHVYLCCQCHGGNYIDPLEAQSFHAAALRVVPIVKKVRKPYTRTNKYSKKNLLGEYNDAKEVEAN